MRTRPLAFSVGSSLALFAAFNMWSPAVARACGCLTPPDPSVPVVQAGENILFSAENGEITAQIQIQYSGDAKDFGWLLPLPSVPKLELGVDELFTRLLTTTQPKYRLTAVYEGNCFGGSNGGNNFAPPQPAVSAADAGMAADDHNPLVYQDSVGPYDYAVLKADDKADMLKWLSDNHYVSTATDKELSPYIHKGAFFLALKLKPGSSAGELQPVVVHYQSDLAMIPIVLTSVAAKPDMGIQVWMLGQGRAIPRNYYHTVINDALIDWQNAGSNYNKVIIQAVNEAPDRHSFVTEYAGKSTPMQKQLNSPGRFGSLVTLASTQDPVRFVQYLLNNGFINQSNGPFFSRNLSSTLVALLRPYLPEPDRLVKQGVASDTFYNQLEYYLQYFGQIAPSEYATYAKSFDPPKAASDINERIVQPTLNAGVLFDKFPYLTRLYTTLSPEFMTADPVFSFNPSLADVGNVHEATITYHCGYGSGASLSAVPATLVTEEKWTLEYPSGTSQSPALGNLPASERIEILGEEGAPRIYRDNTTPVSQMLATLPGAHSHAACNMSTRALPSLFPIGVLLLIGTLLVRRRRAE